MLVSLRWLRELLPGLPDSPQKIAERLTAVGHAVDGLASFGEAVEQVVVAEVRRVEPHPTRAQLKLVTLDRGEGVEVSVLCGAPNVPPPGGKVVLAGIGARLSKGDQPLKARVMDGVPSHGMLCSEAELGLSDSSTGLWILPDEMRPGTAIALAHPELVDTVFDLDTSPNRPDALGHLGVARDLAAVYELPFALPDVDELAASEPPPFAVDNRDTVRCPSYGAAAVVDVEVRPSPAFMRHRLHRLGIRPLSNIVDITNWLMLLYGHPMHGFDLDRVAGQRIVIRRAEPAEELVTLDGVAHRLDPDDLVIADGKQSTALAGVMGGATSEISGDTRRVLFECAYFEPRGIRRTARRHGMHTESSHRFERGVDFAAPARVLGHARRLAGELAGARAVGAATLVGGELPALPRIKLRQSRLDALLGRPVPLFEAKSKLLRLGFEVAPAAGDIVELTVRGASHRPDVQREADLIDEVARTIGLDKIPSVLPAMRPQLPSQVGHWEKAAREQAVALGLSEALLMGFVNKKHLKWLKAPAPVVELSNPLSEERTVLRTTLLPGLLEAVQRAARHGETAARLFAVGSVFLAQDASPDFRTWNLRPRAGEDQGHLPIEVPHFAAVLAGPRPEYMKRPEPMDVFDAKGVALAFVERLTRRLATVAVGTELPGTAHLHPRACAQVLVDGVVVGTFGTLHPDLVDAFELPKAVQVVELDLFQLARLGRAVPRHRPIPRLPAIVRDISLEVPDAVPAQEILTVLGEAAGELCESVEVFDQFKGGGLPPDRRALAFRIVYRDPKSATEPDKARSLTDVEIDERQQQVIRAVAERLGATLRA